MLRRLQLLGMILGLSLVSLGCGGSEDNPFQNFVFDYEPEFTGFSGGSGVSSNPMNGIWHLEFTKALSSGSEIFPAVSYTFMAQAVSSTKALGMTMHPNDDASTYIEMFLTGSNIEVRIFEYEPESDGVVKIIANGTYDLGTRTVASTTYSVEVFGTGAKQDGDGFWEGNSEPASSAVAIVTNNSCGVPPTLTPVRFVAHAGLADDNGQGDMEARIVLNLTGMAGNTVTGTADVTFVNDEGTDIITDSLSVSGTRGGSDLSDQINLVLSGTIGGVSISGSGNINASMDTQNPDPEPACTPAAVVSGELHLDTGSGSAQFAAREFAGTIGQGEFIEVI